MVGEEIRVPVPGGDLAVIDHGGQGHDVLLVHSVGYCASIWNQLAPQLSLDARVLSFDLRGHGASSAEFDDSSDLVADIVTLVRTLGLRRPVLAGHQFGGCLATDIVDRHPDLFGALALVDSPALEPRAELVDLVGVLGTDELIALHTARWGFGVSGPDAASLEVFLQRYTHLLASDWLGGGSSTAGARAHLERSVCVAADGSWRRRPDPATLRGIARAATRSTSSGGSETVGRLDLPVWVIAPVEGDFHISTRDFAEVAAGRPDWHLCEVRGNSHAVQNQPESIRTPLADLIKGLSAGHGEAALSLA